MDILPFEIPAFFNQIFRNHRIPGINKVPMNCVFIDAAGKIDAVIGDQKPTIEAVHCRQIRQFLTIETEYFNPISQAFYDNTAIYQDMWCVYIADIVRQIGKLLILYSFHFSSLPKLSIGEGIIFRCFFYISQPLNVYILLWRIIYRPSASNSTICTGFPPPALIPFSQPLQ